MSQEYPRDEWGEARIDLGTFGGLGFDKGQKLVEVAYQDYSLTVVLHEITNALDPINTAKVYARISQANGEVVEPETEDWDNAWRSYTLSLRGFEE